MYYRRYPQRNCQNNCNPGSCRNNCAQNNCNQGSCGNNCSQNNCNQGSCQNNCVQNNCNQNCCLQHNACPCEEREEYTPSCNNERRCQPCYNEEDYKVDVICELFEEYCRIESRADAHFNNALAKLCNAIEEIEKGLHCNREGREVWDKMERWLARYYERYGEYCGCIDKMHEFRDCVKKLLILEWSSLEATKIAYTQLGESRNLDKQLYCLKSDIQDRCLPKC